MPWSVKQDDRCPADKPWGVVKDTDNALEGCHDTEEAAKKQQAALYASEGRSEDDGDPRERPPRDNLVRAMDTTGFRAAESEVTDGRLGTIFGRMATYNTWAEVQSRTEGHFMERVAPGAFTKTFAENRSRMRLIYDHGQDPHVGRNSLGPLEDIADDQTGIDYTGALIDTDYNKNRILPQLRAGVLGSSYRFDTVKDSWKQNPGRSAYNPDGLPERTVIEAKVIELGPTVFPVAHGTSAGVRSLTDEYLTHVLIPDAPALPAEPEASPQSEPVSRSTAVYPPISLDDFVEKLSGHS
jgi:HK97 family phage prohead protease